MDAPPRSLFRLSSIDPPGVDTAESRVEFRAVHSGDTTALGRLMERAYVGTIDEDLGDNTDGVVEVQDWLGSGGRPECSCVVISGARLLAACLISLAPSGKWWVGYVFTDPEVKARGLGTAVTAQALDRVRAAGAQEIWAGVTDGNAPSERLLRRLGFVRVGPA